MKQPERRGLRFREVEDDAEVPFEPQPPPPYRSAVPSTRESLSTGGTREQPPFPQDEARPWDSDMEKAPRDGAMVELRRADGSVALAVCRRTRRKAAIGWELVSFFSDPVTRHEIKGEITAWRRPEGFLTDLIRGRM